MTMSDETSFPLDLVRCDLRDIIKALDNGTITSVSLTQEYIRRIHADNHAGRELRAVLQLAPEHLLIVTARMRDMTRKSERRGLLHGIPVLLKDTIATGPSLGLNTTAGTPALLNSPPRRNAACVDLLLHEGIIVLGKANLWALNARFNPDTPVGCSPLGGQVISAFGSQAEVAGSSSGNAVALSAGFCAASIGTETCSSIISPAEKAALFAMKPTIGLTNTDGVIGISSQFDCLAPLGKSAFDVAALLDAMTSNPTSYVEALDLPSKEDIAIGVGRDFASDLSTEELKLFEEAIELLGDMIRQPTVELENLKELDRECYILQLFNVRQKAEWDRYLNGVDGPIQCLEDLIAWHDNHPDVSFHPSNPGQGYLLEAVEYGPDDKQAEAAATAQDAVDRAAKAFRGLLKREHLDVVMWPHKAGPAWISSPGGFPICTVPYKLKADDSPFGLIFVALQHQEQNLLRLMRKCEAIFPSRPTPPGW